MARLAAAASTFVLAMVLVTAAKAQTPDQIVPRVEAAMKSQEAMATAGFFPPSFIILEIAKGVREQVYSVDITPAQMLAILDKVEADPISRFGKAAVAQIRREIEAG